MISTRHIIHPIKWIKSTFDWSIYVNFAPGGEQCTAASASDCIYDTCNDCPWYEYDEPYKPRLRSFIWPYVRNAIRQLVNRCVCFFKGHDLRDLSSAGPDSGNMDHECVRCGRYYRVTLY